MHICATRIQDDKVITAEEKTFGAISDILFSDNDWKLRYFVVKTQHWLKDDEFLLPPTAIERFDWKRRLCLTHLDQSALKKCPKIESQKPISREMEEELHSHFGWAPYWGTPYSIAEANSASDDPKTLEKEYIQKNKNNLKGHLRSVNEIIGYHIHTSDTTLGQVNDLILRTKSWVVDAIVLELGNIFTQKLVMLPPEHIQGISWTDAEINVNIDKNDLMHLATFDPHQAVNHETVEVLYDYHGNPV